MELREVVFYKKNREELEEDIENIILPYEEFLISKGFRFISLLEFQSMVKKIDRRVHNFNYYHDELDILATISTLPYRGALVPATMDFTTFYESYKYSSTYDCFAHNFVSTNNRYIFDHYYASWEKTFQAHLTDRKIESEVIVNGYLTEEGFNAFSEVMTMESLDEMISRKIIRTTNDGYKFRYSWGYLSYIFNSLVGESRAKKAYKRVKEESAESQPTKVELQSEQSSLMRSSGSKVVEKSTKEKIRTFIVSGIFFVLFFGMIGIPWSVLPLLIVVLIIHELGHLFAMKFFGYNDTSIFFIPLFGAAAKGEKENVRAWEEYIIFLAGPLPGIFISIAIGIMIIVLPELRDNALLREYALLSFSLNYINLLPIYPLDGGKVVQTLLFSTYPRLKYYFFLVSLSVIIFSAIFLKSPLLALFALLLFFNINHQSDLAKLLELLKDTKVENLEERAREYLSTERKFEKLTLDKKRLLLKSSVKILKSEKATMTLRILGMFFYLLMVIAPIAILMFAGAIGSV